MRKVVPVFLAVLFLAACASTQTIPGRYAVVVDRELAASRWEVEALVDELGEQLGEVDLVAVPTGASYDAVIQLDVKHARGISTVDYKIFKGEKTKKGHVLIGRTTRDVIYREYPPDADAEAAAVMRISAAPTPGRFLGWHRLPPAEQVQTLARMIVRDIERMR